MKKYDVLVIGSGAGMNIASSAFERGMSVAVVEHGPMGGTCLNRGCIPTKILTYPADIIADIQESSILNIKAQVNSVDFEGLMERMREDVAQDSQAQGQSVDAVDGLDWYKETGVFQSEYTLKAGDTTITAPLIYIVSGARPYIPPIKGLDSINYLTSKTVLELTHRPESMIIVGGGYIACEFGHFFAAVGTKVTILGRNPFLVKKEDNDVSELLKKQLQKRMTVLTNHEVIEAKEKSGKKVVIAKDRDTNTEKEFEATTLLLASGRIPNSDLLKPEKTGVKTDSQGYVIVDEYFRTSKSGIWAFGDAIGKHMFRHVANDESQIVWYNSMLNKQGDSDKMIPLSYHAVPRAIFSRPQIATVGMTFREARQSGIPLMVGQADYKDTAKGLAMGDPEGFVRVLANAENQQIIGATVIGHYAPILIQEIINLMYTNDRRFIPLLRAMHIHPALPEVVQRAVGRLAPIDHHHQHTHNHEHAH